MKFLDTTPQSRQEAGIPTLVDAQGTPTNHKHMYIQTLPFKDNSLALPSSKYSRLVYMTDSWPHSIMDNMHLYLLGLNLFMK